MTFLLELVIMLSPISLNLTEIQRICQLDFGKVLWNWLYMNLGKYPLFHNETLKICLIYKSCAFDTMCASKRNRIGVCLYIPLYTHNQLIWTLFEVHIVRNYCLFGKTLYLWFILVPKLSRYCVFHNNYPYNHWPRNYDNNL